MEVLHQIRQAVPDRPARPEDMEKGRADGMLEMLELRLDWVLYTPVDTIDNLKLVIDDGFLRLLADGVRFAHERGSRFTYVTKYLIGYATYPSVLTALLPGLNSQILSKAVLLRTGGQAQAYLSGLIIGLEPLRKNIPDECQIGLYYNLTHSTLSQRTGSQTPSEKVCSGCHTVAYCSRKCQVDDWKAIHRRECSEMRKRGEIDSRPLHLTL
ncbi:hypothetical protein FA13DRAFT_875205 [Coprinellus micaceus]|uniref:MYND-type domain-containing protein n=1 Tax=Coprinellus micaceus TaxID=71717 RepID=A0A4Y7T0D8_COPMI|nr:hypothetical protein FA13DRAFT_875205 [Coprinellus micaceus]